MNQKVLHKVFIWGFLFLYFLVALISFCHAVQFFGIGNVQWMSISLAFAFELGLALSLASILLSDENKKQTLPWILMITLTAVQVVGNVYSVFKYISLADQDYYQYLAKPLLFFIEEVDANTIQVIVSWIMGAILPIVALMMTDMVASNIKIASSSENNIDEKENTPKIENADAFDKGNIPAFNVIEETPDSVQDEQGSSEQVEENVKEEKANTNEDDNIIDYVDVLTPAANNKGQSDKSESKQREAKNKASILDYIPGKLFKKKSASSPYFKDPIVNHNEK